MSEAQPRRLDLSLHEESSLPPPSTAELGMDQPVRPSTEPRRPDVLFEQRRPRFEMPSDSALSRKARDAWEYTREQASELGSRLGHQVEDLGAQMTCWIRRHPSTSLLCGFSLGFLLADAIVYMRSRGR